MTLNCDYQRQIYVWVDDDNAELELSPHFDYEEDADQWYQQRHQHSDHSTNPGHNCE